MKLEDAVSQEILNRTWGAIKLLLKEDCCIAATAIFTAVLKNLGFRAEPASVNLIVYNPKFVEWGEANGWREPTDDEVKALKKANARMIIVGSGRPSPGKWPGHLVTVAWPRGGQGSAYIIDLSAPQAHRPEKQISVSQPLRVEMPVQTMRGFLKGAGKTRGMRPDGSLIEYNCVAGDASYHVSPDWAEQKTRFREYVDEFTKAIREFAKEAATSAGAGVDETREEP